MNNRKTVEGPAAAHVVVRAGNVEQEQSEGADRAIRRRSLAFVQDGGNRLYFPHLGTPVALNAQKFQKAGSMKSQRKAIIFTAILMVTSIVSSSVFVKAQDEPNPDKEKFQEDLKAAVMNESITVAQLKEIKENLAILKEAKSERQPGAPVDLMTPYSAVTKIRATMASVKEPDRTTLRQDFQLMMATKQPEPSAEPDTPGKKLGKDIFAAVMHGEPTPPQVQQLQESLNSLESIKTSGGGMLEKFRAMKTAKSQIEETMNAGSFRPEDKQAVLDDLNNLGGKGGSGGGLRRQGL
ncbi:hypothetical protein [Tunturibacter empetritectus]|uniref:hypothetical protein n=1 Tax=Tunturiibacter empetritectus TaxID=3069691 RepID=UPI0021A880A1|nr:hypothetical protein [Edaphobacter lichenicola]